MPQRSGTLGPEALPSLAIELNQILALNAISATQFVCLAGLLAEAHFRGLT